MDAIEIMQARMVALEAAEREAQESNRAEVLEAALRAVLGTLERVSAVNPCKDRCVACGFLEPAVLGHDAGCWLMAEVENARRALLVL